MVEGTKTLEQEVNKDSLSLIRKGHLENGIVKAALENNKLSDVRDALIAGLLLRYFECNGKYPELSRSYFNTAKRLHNNEEIQYSSDIIIPLTK